MAFSGSQVVSKSPDGRQPSGLSAGTRARTLASHLAGCGRAGTVLPVAGQHVGGLVNENFPDDLQGLVQDRFES